MNPPDLIRSRPPYLPFPGSAAPTPFAEPDRDRLR
jgi:hypothetical protein